MLEINYIKVFRILPAWSTLNLCKVELYLVCGEKLIKKEFRYWANQVGPSEGEKFFPPKTPSFQIKLIDWLILYATKFIQSHGCLQKYQSIIIASYPAWKKC